MPKPRKDASKYSRLWYLGRLLVATVRAKVLNDGRRDTTVHHHDARHSRQQYTHLQQNKCEERSGVGEGHDVAWQVGKGREEKGTGPHKPRDPDELEQLTRGLVETTISSTRPQQPGASL